MANAKSTARTTEASAAEVDPSMAMPDFSKFVETTTGFPPYWNPLDGKKFYAKVIAIDIRDPKFPRYTLIAGPQPDGKVLKCQSGPADDATPVDVALGERFSCSVYARMPLDRFMNEWVLIEALKKSKGGEGGMWSFKLTSTPETKAVVATRSSFFEWNGGGKPSITAQIPAYLSQAISAGALPQDAQA